MSQYGVQRGRWNVTLYVPQLSASNCVIFSLNLLYACALNARSADGVGTPVTRAGKQASGGTAESAGSAHAQHNRAVTKCLKKSCREFVTVELQLIAKLNYTKK